MIQSEKFEGIIETFNNIGLSKSYYRIRLICGWFECVHSSENPVPAVLILFIFSNEITISRDLGLRAFNCKIEANSLLMHR